MVDGSFERNFHARCNNTGCSPYYLCKTVVGRCSTVQQSGCCRRVGKAEGSVSDDVAASTEARKLRPSGRELGEHLQQWFPMFVGWVIYKIRASQADAEDIVMDAYTSVCKLMTSDVAAADRWERSSENERKAYLRRAVGNKATDYLRAKREVLHSLDEVADEPDPDADPARVVARSVTAAEVWENLRSLSQRDKEVLLPTLEGIPPREQARHLGITDGAYRTASTRARQRYAAKFPQHKAEDI